MEYTTTAVKALTLAWFELSRKRNSPVIETDDFILNKWDGGCPCKSTSLEARIYITQVGAVLKNQRIELFEFFCIDEQAVPRQQ